jgi:hypothetical protein
MIIRFIAAAVTSPVLIQKVLQLGVMLGIIMYIKHTAPEYGNPIFVLFLTKKLLEIYLTFEQFKEDQQLLEMIKNIQGIEVKQVKIEEDKK